MSYPLYRIILDIGYYLPVFIASYLIHIYNSKQSTHKKTIQTIQSKIQNVMYYYLIENRGVSKISIIIPTYNEEKNILRTLHAVNTEPNIEIIISDGGSNDKTEEICKEFKKDLIFITGGTNRATCQNLGAKRATGDVVLFLHADTILPCGYGAQVREAITNPMHLVGSFTFDVDDKSLSGMGFITQWVALRCRYFATPYGDQALFMRREIFGALGGFPSVPLMEDYDLVRLVHSVAPTRLQSPDGTGVLGAEGSGSVNPNGCVWVSKMGVCVVTGKVLTSHRRWLHNGVWWNTIVNQIVIFGRSIGVPHDTLAQWYYGVSRKKNY